MFVTVFRVRDRGVRLPTPRPGIGGYLELKPARERFGKTELHARLLLNPEQSTTLLPDLHHAHVRQITSYGLHLVGIEVIARRNTTKASADSYRQTWWCLVHSEEGKLVLEDLEDPGAMPQLGSR